MQILEWGIGMKPTYAGSMFYFQVLTALSLTSHIQILLWIFFLTLSVKTSIFTSAYCRIQQASESHTHICHTLTHATHSQWVYELSPKGVLWPRHTTVCVRGDPHIRVSNESHSRPCLHQVHSVVLHRNWSIHSTQLLDVGAGETRKKKQNKKWPLQVSTRDLHHVMFNSVGCY